MQISNSVQTWDERRSNISCSWPCSCLRFCTHAFSSSSSFIIERNWFFLLPIFLWTLEVCVRMCPEQHMPYLVRHLLFCTSFNYLILFLNVIELCICLFQKIQLNEEKKLLILHLKTGWHSHQWSYIHIKSMASWYNHFIYAPVCKFRFWIR